MMESQGPPPDIGGSAPPMANDGGLNDSMWAGPPRYDIGKDVRFRPHVRFTGLTLKQ